MPTAVLSLVCLYHKFRLMCYSINQPPSDMSIGISGDDFDSSEVMNKSISCKATEMGTVR